MKVEQYVLVFFLLVFSTFVTFYFKIDSLKAVDNTKVEYNRNCDAAADAAVDKLIDSVDDNTTQINLDACVSNFYHSMFASFNLLDSSVGQENLEMYVPVILVTDTNGFYINYHSRSSSTGDTKRQWTQRMPYTYSGSVKSSDDSLAKTYRYVVNLSLEDTVTLAVQVDNHWVSYTANWNALNSVASVSTRQYTLGEREGFIECVQLLSKNGFLKDEGAFKSFKLSAIQYQISKKMAYYVNHHNEVAQARGINYKFSLPVSATDSIAQTIASVSVLAVIQGLPYTNGSEDTFSRFSVSGSKLTKNSHYCITEENGVKYYHRDSCLKYSKSLVQYDSRSACAKLGAWPCPDCMP